MSEVVADPGSFRDPSGRVYSVGNKIFRTITKHGVVSFEFVRKTGLIDRLEDGGRIISTNIVATEVLGDIGKGEVESSNLSVGTSFSNGIDRITSIRLNRPPPYPHKLLSKN